MPRKLPLKPEDARPRPSLPPLLEKSTLFYWGSGLVLLAMAVAGVIWYAN